MSENLKNLTSNLTPQEKRLIEIQTEIQKLKGLKNSDEKIKELEKEREGLKNSEESIIEHEDDTIELTIEEQKMVEELALAIESAKKRIAEYESDMALLRKEQEAEEKETNNTNLETIGYLKTIQDGVFHTLSKTPESCFFRLFNQRGNTANFEFSGDERSGIANKDAIAEVCKISGTSIDPTNIRNMEAGIVTLQSDGTWKITQKAKIKFIQQEEEIKAGKIEPTENSFDPNSKKDYLILNKEIWEFYPSDTTRMIDPEKIKNYESIKSLEEINNLADGEYITIFGPTGGNSWDKVSKLKTDIKNKDTSYLSKSIENGLMVKGKIKLEEVTNKTTVEDIENANKEGKYEQAVRAGRMSIEKALDLLKKANIEEISEELLKLKKEIRGVKENETIIGKLYDQQGDLRMAGMFAVDEPEIKGGLPLIKYEMESKLVNECIDEHGISWKIGETIIDDNGKIDRIIGIQDYKPHYFCYLLNHNEGSVDKRPTNPIVFKKFNNKEILKDTIMKSIERKDYTEWIKEGRITKSDARRIIESAGFNVPKELI